VNRTKILCFFAVALLIAGTGLFLTWMKTHQQLGRPGVALDLPVRVLDYDSTPLEVSEIEKKSLPADTSFARRMYYKVVNGQTNYIQVSVVLMGSDRTSIHKPQFCLRGQGWDIEQTTESDVQVEQPHPYKLPVMKLITGKTITGDGGRSIKRSGIYAYWFVADHALTANHWQRMWWMAKNLMTTGVLQRWAYVSCFSTCWPGEEEALFAELRRFVGASAPSYMRIEEPSQAASPMRDREMAQ
jgi:hypothetical protein